MLPRYSASLCSRRISSSRHNQLRNLSLSLFRDKKSASSQDTTKCGVPSIHHAGTSDSVYPPLRLESAVSARPKREKRRIPLFPEGGPFHDIRGDSAGDDAWVLGKYYLGTRVFCVLIDIGVGVADGVGAWNMKENGRPGLWSRLLMHYWALECEERMKLWKVDRTTSTTGFNMFGNEEEVDIASMLQRA